MKELSAREFLPCSNALYPETCSQSQRWPGSKIRNGVIVRATAVADGSTQCFGKLVSVK
jgi:hypothetical protein